MAEHGLGRLVEHDPRSRNFRVLPLLAVAVPPLVSKTWRRGQAYDQGQTPQCVAYTGKGLLNTAPASAAVPYDVRSRYQTEAFYTGAQINDEWPSEDYDGTSALGLGKYLANVGLIREYRWCFGLDEVLHTLSYISPVGIGIGWRTGMWETDADGFVHATGADEGGHEVELIGINVLGKYVIGMNSWGSGWGVNGRFKLSWEDLGIVLNDHGDAVVLVP